MPVIVQKFGGTSLADTSRLMHCAKRAVEAHRLGQGVVVVVSAMGQTTDELVERARQITSNPSTRELDLLLSTGEQISSALMTMAIQALGAEAISFTSHHLGIITDPVHCSARIRSIDRQRIGEQLEFGRIVVAAGFQGVTEDGQVTTLGRGGSDLTAVALAAALGVCDDSGACEIYTDVDGVFTADPRHVPEAVKLDSIGYEEMLELASLGAGVLHCRAAIFAQKYNVPLHIRHSQKPQSGTLVMKDPLDQSSLESVSVVGCALTNDLVMISLHGLPNAMHPSDAGLNDSPQAIIFRHAADAGVFIDDIMQTEDGRKANISFTAPREGLEALKRAVECALDVIGEGDLAVRTGLAKVSAVGVGMRSHTGVASTMFNALAEAGIGIRTITTSEIKISCIVDESESAEALRVVHRAFGLETRGQSCADTKSASLMPHVEVKTNLGKTMSS